MEGIVLSQLSVSKAEAHATGELIIGEMQGEYLERASYRLLPAFTTPGE